MSEGSEVGVCSLLAEQPSSLDAPRDKSAQYELMFSRVSQRSTSQEPHRHNVCTFGVGRSQNQIIYRFMVQQNCVHRPETHTHAVGIQPHTHTSLLLAPGPQAIKQVCLLDM